MKTKTTRTRDAPKIRRLERRMDTLEKTQDVTLSLLQRALRSIERLELDSDRNQAVNLHALAIVSDSILHPQEPTP